jgi:hypothetical protein
MAEIVRSCHATTSAVLATGIGLETTSGIDDQLSQFIGRS